MTIHDVCFPEQSAPERLDQFVARSIPELTRAAVQRLIEQGQVTVGGERAKASQKLKPGDLVQVCVPPPRPAAADAEVIPLQILHEDNDLVVVNKPAGMVVHPGAGNPRGTLVNALLGHCSGLSGVGGEERPGVVHRIDKDTSGLLVVAKNDRTHLHLARQFKEHTIKRIYLALVFGSPHEDKGRIQSSIGRHPQERTRMSSSARQGRNAVTHWRVLARYPGVSLLRLKLETGRTHQIRVHLSEAGHPLLGDQLYGGQGRLTSLQDPRLRRLIKDMGRQALHATSLGFIHPGSGNYLEFNTQLPDDMEQIIQYLEQSGQTQQTWPTPMQQEE